MDAAFALKTQTARKTKIHGSPVEKSARSDGNIQIHRLGRQFVDPGIDCNG